jgi:hypothetical protein
MQRVTMGLRYLILIGFRADRHSYYGHANTVSSFDGVCVEIDGPRELREF